MSLRVIGAGVGRTGTGSLKQALERLLGGPCHHISEMRKNHHDEIPVWTAAVHGTMPDWHAFLSRYVAIVDWPGAAFWPELSEAFPDALVLLSVREPESWYRSAMETIFAEHTDDPIDLVDLWLWRTIARNRICDDGTDKDRLIAAMIAHNEAVEAAIPADRLLKWQAGDGWEPICAALNLPVPDEPFPHTNTKAQFLAS